MISAERSEHSSKPEIFCEIIERMYPQATRIELFRRGEPRPGWAAWGNEVAPPYDADADFEGSINDCYSAVRTRVAAGGPSWEPKAAADDDLWPELPACLRRTP